MSTALILPDELQAIIPKKKAPEGVTIKIPRVVSAEEWAAMGGNRWVEGMPDRQYHLMHEFVSSTGLKKFGESPVHFLNSIFNNVLGHGKAETESLRLGRAVHMLVLEPRRFHDTVKMEPEFEGHPNSKAHREAKAAWYEDLPPGCEVLSKKEFERLMGMAISVLKHPRARRFFENGICEMSGFYRDPRTGLLCRIRPDFLSTDPELSMLVDLKTTRDPAKEAFSKAIYNFGYHTSLAKYGFGAEQISGYRPRHNVFFCVQNVEPYSVAIYEADDGMMSLGLETYHALVESMARWVDKYKLDPENLELPPYQTDIEMIGFPMWVYNKGVPAIEMPDMEEEEDGESTEQH